MSPTRRQVLASIAGIAAASTFDTSVASRPAPAPEAEPFEITGFLRYCHQPAGTFDIRERMPMMTLTFDPTDGTLAVRVAHACDESLCRERIYEHGSEIVRNLIDDVEEFYAIREQGKAA